MQILSGDMAIAGSEQDFGQSQALACRPQACFLRNQSTVNYPQTVDEIE